MENLGVNAAASSMQSRHRSVFLYASEICVFFAPISGENYGRSKKEIKTERCLADDWRWPGKELWMPVACNCPDFKDRRRHVDLDQSDKSRSDQNRHSCVHHDAQGAMIGVADSLVGMSNLRNRQQRQQQQT